MTSTLTNNLNLMQPNTFQVVMDRMNFGTSTYMAQSFVHPSVSLGYSLQGFGNKDIVQPGAKFEIDGLQITFLIDEDMKIYDELYNYMVFTRDVNMSTNITKLLNRNNEDKYSHFTQITINILSNKNNVLRSIKYLDCVIVDLGNIDFTALDGEQFLTLTATFRFSEFEVI